MVGSVQKCDNGGHSADKIRESTASITYRLFRSCSVDIAMKSTYHEFITPIQLEYDIDLSESSSCINDRYSNIEFSADSMDVVKVIFLGAQGVGKTSIIQVGLNDSQSHPFS
ncbi:hypothetical protein PGB90_004492 [Kerria lacca]